MKKSFLINIFLISLSSNFKTHLLLFNDEFIPSFQVCATVTQVVCK